MKPNDNGTYVVKASGDFAGYSVDKYVGINEMQVLRDWVLKQISDAKNESKIPTVMHKCHNCGAHLELDENDHIFKCHYCGTAYAVGTSMVNDVG